jgi:hypothetical protein
LLLHCSMNVVVDCVSISNVVYISGFIFGEKRIWGEFGKSKRKKKEINFGRNSAELWL